jgi:hypothetical protein
MQKKVPENCRYGLHCCSTWFYINISVDLFDLNSQRSTTEGLDPIPAYGGKKLFSPSFLAVVEGRRFFPIYS